MNDYKEKIIYKSWDIILNDKKIKNFYFIPGLISTIFLMVTLLYQSTALYFSIFEPTTAMFRLIFEYFDTKIVIEVLIAWCIFFVIYIIAMPLLEGLLISYISKKEKDDTYVSIGDGFGESMYRFLPFFEYGNSISMFKFITLINEYLFFIRLIGIEYFFWINIAFAFLFIIATIVNILFVYGKYEVVLNNKSMGKAFKESVKITMFNFKYTIKTYFLMFLLNLRIVLNFIVFAFFPILILLAITYITTQIYLYLTIGFLLLIFIILVIFLGYLGGVLDILKTSIWYNMYIEGKKNIKEYEEDEEDEDNNV